MSNIKKKVERIICNILSKKNNISSNTDLTKLKKWDSINIIKIILAIEEEFAIKLNSKHYEKLKTVKDFVLAVQDNYKKNKDEL
jgi:acyl carrier protein